MNTSPATTSTPRVGSPLPYNALIWLAVAAFSTGIDGYVLAGLLPKIAGELSVTEALAGQLVSVFALTSALAAPLLGTATSSWERRRTIALALAVFVLGNLVVALAPIYPVALAGRVIAALGGCLLNAAITGHVIHLAPPEHRGKALSFVLGGWMTATALGVPVGLVLGQTSWRFPLVMVSVVGTVALIGILIKLPKLRLPPTTLAERLLPLKQPRLVAGLLVTTGILCASYTCFTYAVLILSPTHPAGWMMILIMFGYGLASMLGNAFTGRLADRFTPLRVLTVILIGLFANALLGAVAFAAAAPAVIAVLGLAWFFLAGIGNGGAAVPQQARLASMAPQSAAIVMALNASAISLGSALGGGLGGLTLTAGAPAPSLLWVAAGVLALTLILHGVVAGLTARHARQVAADPA
ncbi:MFS transporter [Microlunatus soli]|uniref:Predicted arabinose efflux permease, MFS family n=1 Tax=Microlunatus soli TaxID=630515 RepID=A0A1H1R664_9ACTN|nr:MFS transporter [Microlunatus soli]SDS31222.1 Predicted arabinose efflux permease, MFS family [Microlunatus soli]